VKNQEDAKAALDTANKAQEAATNTQNNVNEAKT